MRRLPLPALLLSLLLTACATPAQADDEPPTPTPCETEAEAEPTFPSLSVTDSHVATGTLVVKGKVDNAKVPATFRLRSENGCARDAKLRTQTIGIGFSFTLDAAELTDAFGCAVDVEVGDAALSPIAVSPTATVSVPSKSLALDPGVALVSAGLEPSTERNVRFMIMSDHALQGARVDLGGRTYRATLAPMDSSTEGESTAIFEVPARAWADAVIVGSSARVSTTDSTGHITTMEVKPEADVTSIGVDEESGC